MTGQRRAKHLGLGLAALLALGAVAAASGLWAARAGAQFVRYPAEELAQVKNVHAYQGRPACQACHPDQSAALRGDALSVCSRCHAFEAHQSHVVGVPQLDPPASAVKLPLGEGALIVCHTCHDPHVDMRTAHGLRGPDDPNRLCVECHLQH